MSDTRAEELAAFEAWFRAGQPEFGPTFELGWQAATERSAARIAELEAQVKALEARTLTDAKRLEWLHTISETNPDKNGYEWGVFRVKWQGGKAVEVWQTNRDSSDVDAAMRGEVALRPTYQMDQATRDAILQSRRASAMAAADPTVYGAALRTPQGAGA